LIAATMTVSLEDVESTIQDGLIHIGPDYVQKAIPVMVVPT
jgi:hypothetical protein